MGTETVSGSSDWREPAIFVDTTELRKSPRLDKAGWPEVLAWAREGIVGLAISDVVLREAQRQQVEQREADARELRQVISKFAHTEARNLDLDRIEEEARTEASQYRKRTRKHIEDSGGTILPLPKVSHARVLDRDLGTRKPFARSGKGYRDTLIWESLVEFVKTLRSDQMVVFVTGNANDFAGDTAAGLDKLLLAEIDSPERVRYFPSLRDAVRAMSTWAEQELQMLFEIDRQDEVDQRVEEAVITAAEQDVIGQELGAEAVAGFAEVQVPSEIENPTVVSMDIDLSSFMMDVYDRYEGDTLAIQASIAATLYIEGFVYKADAAMLGNDIDIIDKDWNDHMMLVGLQRDVEVQYYVTTIGDQVEDLTFDAVSSR